MTPSDQAITEALLDAYRQGVFPMADPNTGRIGWYSPDPRALMPVALEGSGVHGPVFHVSRSLGRKVKRNIFEVTADTAFERVIRACGEPRDDRPDSWIDERIVAWYTALARTGHAHSVEAWLGTGAESRLVGGVYGVSIGGAFFAESMFCRPEIGGTDASKVCLVRLVQHLASRGYALMDVQLRNDHTDQFGVFEVSRAKYLKMLKAAVELDVTWGAFGALAAPQGDSPVG